MDTLRYDWQLSLEHPVFAQYSHHKKGESLCVADMHSAVHLGILVQGDTTGLYNGEIIKITEGKLYLTAPWEPHKSIFSSEGNILLLISFCQEALDHSMLACAQKIKNLFRLTPTRRHEILNTLTLSPEYSKQIIELLKTPNSSLRELKLWHLVLGILIEIASLDYFVDTELDSNYTKLLPSLQNLSNKPLSVGEAATFCNLSKSHFAHMFSKVFGMPFAQYERLYRLRCALTELNTKKNGLKEVAENWGFYDKSHFSKICKKYLKNSSNKQ